MMLKWTDRFASVPERFVHYDTACDIVYTSLGSCLNGRFSSSTNVNLHNVLLYFRDWRVIQMGTIPTNHNAVPLPLIFTFLPNKGFKKVSRWEAPVMPVCECIENWLWTFCDTRLTDRGKYKQIITGEKRVNTKAKPYFYLMLNQACVTLSLRTHLQQ